MNNNYTPIEQKTQDDYDSIAPSFARSRQNLHWPELDQLIAEVAEGSKVLDIGCGTGRVCRFFGDLKIDYTGIDISKDQLVLAERSCANGKFIHGSMLDLPFEDGSFDVAFSVASLHHLITPGERLKSLQEVKRVLKNEGVLYLTVMGLWLPKYRKLFFSKQEGKKSMTSDLQKQIKWNDIFLPWTKESAKKVYRYYHAFTMYELSKSLKTAGFTIESLSYRREGKPAKWYRGKNIVAKCRKVV